ncbi:TPA: hypothetical protein EYP83_00330 [Candidatus Geothermarchaeota archaeon]|nr:hypothetical protein [Candidatus Geothermarchaeota archaeon]HIQ13489.1 hypothetical protein [Thermoprotei archaeon]
MSRHKLYLMLSIVAVLVILPIFLIGIQLYNIDGLWGDVDDYGMIEEYDFGHEPKDPLFKLIETSEYREYIWPYLEGNKSYNCSKPDRVYELGKYYREVLEEYYGLAENFKLRGEVIGIILLNDMYIRRRNVGNGYSDILYGPELHAYKFFQDACIMKSRLDNIGEYIDKARELFGEPSFTIETLETIFNKSLAFKANRSTSEFENLGDFKILQLHILYLIHSSLYDVIDEYGPFDWGDLRSKFRSLVDKLNSDIYLKGLLYDVFAYGRYFASDIYVYRDYGVEADPGEYTLKAIHIWLELTGSKTLFG